MWRRWFSRLSGLSQKGINLGYMPAPPLFGLVQNQQQNAFSLSAKLTPRKTGHEPRGPGPFVVLEINTGCRQAQRTLNLCIRLEKQAFVCIVLAGCCAKYGPPLPILQTSDIARLCGVVEQRPPAWTVGISGPASCMELRIACSHIRNKHHNKMEVNNIPDG